MNKNLLFWTYLVNAVILIVHEIDSAYWQEWRMLNANNPNGITVFLILHLPMVFVIILGLILVYENKLAGKIISIILSVGGIFAFFFHNYFLSKGNSEFNTIVSKSLINITFILSIFQMFLTIKQIINPLLQFKKNISQDQIKQ